MSDAIELPPGYRREDNQHLELPEGYTLAPQGEMRDSASPEIASQRVPENPLISGLLGNDTQKGWTNPQNWMEEAGRYGPQIAGATIGSVAGPIGAMWGAAAGESLRGVGQQIASLYGMAPQMDAGEAVLNPTAAWLGEGAGQAAAVAGAKYVMPAAKKAVSERLSGALQSLAHIERNAADVASKDFLAPARGMTNRSSALYEAFDKANGTTSLKEAAQNSIHPQESISNAALKEHIRVAQEAAQAGTLTPQQAINASQAARMLGQQGMRGSSEISRDVGEMYLKTVKPAFDKFLETYSPTWKAARGAAMDEHVAEQFANLTPHNLNMTPSRLKSAVNLAALGLGGYGEYSGNPMAKAAALGVFALQSPLVWGAGLAGAGAAQIAAKPVYRVMAGPALAETEKNLLNYYQNAR